jgi:hypothetical protein
LKNAFAEFTHLAYDVKMEHYEEATMLYCDSLINTDRYRTYVVPEWRNMLVTGEWKALSGEIEQQLFSGFVLMCLPDGRQFEYPISDPKSRQTQESVSESSLKGPRDGFTEEISTNISLVRKRLKTKSLAYELQTIGKRGNVNVAILYCRDIINPMYVSEVKKRLGAINTDAILGSAQLEEYLSDSPFSIFPLIDYIGRPDFAVQALLAGRFVIFVDGSPSAIIGPVNFAELIKSPEDVHFPYYFTIFQRALRMIGMLVAMFLPSFWVGLSAYNVDQIPYPLLSTLAVARLSIPYPVPLEAFMVLTLFELFREASVRLPSALSQTVAVVGGLIIGDAAIRSGLVSASLLMVTATTAVATYTLVNQSLSGTVSIIRYVALLLSSVLGMYGFFIAMFGVMAYMGSLRSFGVSYYAALLTLDVKTNIVAFFALPFRWMNKRPGALSPIDDTREGKNHK